MKSVLLSVVTALFLFSSCSTINKSHMNSSVAISISSPMKAKIDVDMTRKLTGYASGGYLFHLLKISGDNKYADGIAFNGNEPSVFSMLSKVNAVKAAASYNAIRTSEADVLINPQYVVEESNWNPFYKMIKVKVTGYPGKVVRIRNVQ